MGDVLVTDNSLTKGTAFDPEFWEFSVSMTFPLFSFLMTQLALAGARSERGNFGGGISAGAEFWPKAWGLAKQMRERKRRFQTRSFITSRSREGELFNNTFDGPGEDSSGEPVNGHKHPPAGFRGGAKILKSRSFGHLPGLGHEVNHQIPRAGRGRICQ